MNRATQLGLVLIAASASAALASMGLAATNQTGEANAIAWLAWWTTLVGLLAAILGVATGGLFGLLRGETR